MFGPLIMERHLCVGCGAIPTDVRTSFRQIVNERMCVHINELFDFNIE
jgi:hypothetical protein